MPCRILAVFFPFPDVRADRHARPAVRNRIGQKLSELVGGVRVVSKDVACSFEGTACPELDNALDASLAVFGLMSCRVAALASVDGMRPEGSQYVHDVRRALAETFAWLRGLKDSSRNRDLAERFLEPDQARDLIRRFVTKPEMRPGGRRSASAGPLH